MKFFQKSFVNCKCYYYTVINQTNRLLKLPIKNANSKHFIFNMSCKSKADFFKAAHKGDVDLICEMLNSKQITVEERNELEDNNTALHHAASEGHLHLVKILVEEFKANVNAKNDRDEIPLQKAVDHYFVRVVRYLIQHKSERAEYAAKMTNPQPIEDFFVAAENNDVAKVTEMLKNKVVDVDATDAGHDNGTALHVAARYDYLDLAKALVEFGADMEVTDDIGDRPVETAVILQKTKVADYLIELEGKEDEVAEVPMSNDIANKA